MENTDRRLASEILHIRPVSHRDEQGLGELYDRLNSCNGNRSIVDSVISVSNDSFQKAGGRFTLVSDAHIQGGDTSVVSCVGTASLIRKKADTDSEAIPMYREIPDEGKLRLEWEKMDALEFGAMVVHREYEGGYVGKSLTVSRAIIARVFSGNIGPDKVVAEFLPLYDDDHMNGFYRDAILGYFKSTDSLENLRTLVSSILGKDVATDFELFDALATQINTAQRNEIIKKYFPVEVERARMSNQALEALGTIGKYTVGAKVNLEKAYAHPLDLIGYYPVDGGLNYSVGVEFGALGQKTVSIDFMDARTLAAKLGDRMSTRAVIFRPLSGRMQELRSFEAVVAPIISAKEGIIVPEKVGRLLNIPAREEATYRILPSVTK